jgi:ribosomal protein S18 acetylase RimI-like enzyme
VGFRVVRAEAADWADYRQIRLRALREAPYAYCSTYDRERGFADGIWRDRMAAGRTYLARDRDGTLVGTATVVPGPDDASEVVAMFVAPEARGQGCAEQLLDAVAHRARETGGDRLLMHVTDGNEPARRCYARYGFTETGRQWPMERDPGLLEVEMALPLG